MAVGKNQYPIVDKRKAPKAKALVTPAKKAKAPVVAKAETEAKAKSEPVAAPELSVLEAPREIPQKLLDITEQLNNLSDVISKVVQRTSSFTSTLPPLQPLHVPESGEAQTTVGLALLGIELRLENMTSLLSDLEASIQL